MAVLKTSEIISKNLNLNSQMPYENMNRPMGKYGKIEQNAMMNSKNTKIEEKAIGMPVRDFGDIDKADILFKQFTLLYGRVWNPDGDSDEWIKAKKRLWSDMLSDMTNEEIKLTISYLKSGCDKKFITWPPNPMEFKNISLDISGKNIPELMEAFKAAMDGNWKLHPVVFHCANNCNMYYLRRCDHKEGIKIFKIHYDEAKNRFIKNKSLGDNKKYVKNEKSENKFLNKNNEESIQKMVFFRAKKIINSDEFKSKNGKLNPKDYLNYIRKTLKKGK